MEEAFPSLLERTVASSLLLLSGLNPSLSPPLSEPDSEESQKSFWISDSIACSSFFRDNYSEKSVGMSNSKSTSYSAFLDNCSEKGVGMSNSKSNSYSAFLDVASEKSKGLSKPKWSSFSSLDNCWEKSVGMSDSKSSLYSAFLDVGLEKSKGLSKPKWRSCSSLDDGSEDSIGLSNSKSSSCLSSLTLDDGSSAETRAHRLRMVAVVSRSHQMKFKVARRSRTPIMRKSDYRKKFSHYKMEEEASSCLSSGSSGDGVVVSSGSKPKPPVNSSSIRSRAEGIMRVLSYGCASEVRIRQLLGDSPDTSKALRILLKKEEIQRSGNGGRCDPYIYKIV